MTEHARLFYMHHSMPSTAGPLESPAAAEGAHSTPRSALQQDSETAAYARLIFGTCQAPAVPPVCMPACLRALDKRTMCLALGGLLSTGGGLLAVGRLGTLLCSILVKDLVGSILACGQQSNRACATGSWCGRETSAEVGTQLSASYRSNSGPLPSDSHIMTTVIVHCCLIHQAPVSSLAAGLLLCRKHTCTAAGVLTVHQTPVHWTVLLS
jgi:hypothetical protein